MNHDRPLFDSCWNRLHAFHCEPQSCGTDPARCKHRGHYASHGLDAIRHQR